VKKQITFVGLNGFNPYLGDGVSRAMLELLQYLQERDHSVSILNFTTNEPYKRRFIARGAACGGVQHEQVMLPCSEGELAQGQGVAVQAMLSRLDPRGIDYLFTVDKGFLPLFCAWYQRIPGAHFFHSPAYVGSFTAQPLAVRFLETRTVFASSRFVQRKVRELLGLEAVVWYPLGQIRAFLASERKGRTGAIGFYSGGSHKGDAVINRIMSYLPDRQFVVVGRNYSHPPGGVLHNLRYWEDITDMRRFYGQIGLLLVPSVSEEGFSRVILEAAVNGIPVIANRVGGIPEALGDSGILVDVDPAGELDLDGIAAEYVRAIDRLLGDEALYRSYSDKAIRRAKQYEVEQARLALAAYEKYILEDG
jgi:glycosyltransferase involved in cell wall biosynthesis